jgi:hypothetical protein
MSNYNEGDDSHPPASTQLEKPLSMGDLLQGTGGAKDFENTLKAATANNGAGMPTSDGHAATVSHLPQLSIGGASGKQ